MDKTEFINQIEVLYEDFLITEDAEGEIKKFIDWVKNTNPDDPK